MHIIFSFIAFIFVVISPALAQNKKGLSQLDFDAGVKKSSNATKDIEDLLGSADNLPEEDRKILEELGGLVGAKKPGENIEPETSDTESNKPAKKPLVETSEQLKKINLKNVPGVEYNETELSSDASLIPPRIKGPFVDEDDITVITSKYSWKPSQDVSCVNFYTEGDLCSQASALKEVLNRFTGADDYFSSQCAKTCRTPQTVPTLVDLDIEEGGQTNIKTVGVDGLCHVRMTNGQSYRWLVLKAKKATCACLPTSCVK